MQSTKPHIGINSKKQRSQSLREYETLTRSTSEDEKYKRRFSKNFIHLEDKVLSQWIYPDVNHAHECVSLINECAKMHECNENKK